MTRVAPQITLNMQNHLNSSYPQTNVQSLLNSQRQHEVVQSAIQNALSQQNITQNLNVGTVNSHNIPIQSFDHAIFQTALTSNDESKLIHVSYQASHSNKSGHDQNQFDKQYANYVIEDLITFSPPENTQPLSPVSIGSHHDVSLVSQPTSNVNSQAASDSFPQKTMIDKKKPVENIMSPKSWVLPVNQKNVDVFRNELKSKEKSIPNLTQVSNQKNNSSVIKKSSMPISDSILSPQSSSCNDAALRLQHLEMMANTRQNFYMLNKNSDLNTIVVDRTDKLRIDPLLKNKTTTTLTPTDIKTFENDEYFNYIRQKGMNYSRNNMRKRNLNRTNLTQTSFGQRNLSKEKISQLQSEHSARIYSKNLVNRSSGKQWQFDSQNQRLNQSKIPRGQQKLTTQPSPPKFEIFSPKNEKPKETSKVMKEVRNNLKSLLDDVESIKIQQNYNISQRSQYVQSTIKSNSRSRSPPKMSINSQSNYQIPQEKHFVFPSSIDYSRIIQRKNNTTHIVSPVSNESKYSIDQMPLDMIDSIKTNERHVPEISFKNYITQPSVAQLNKLSPKQQQIRGSDDLYLKNPDNRITFGPSLRNSSKKRSPPNNPNFLKNDHFRNQSAVYNQSQQVLDQQFYPNQFNGGNRRSRNKNPIYFTSVQSPKNKTYQMKQNNTQAHIQNNSRTLFSPVSQSNHQMQRKSPISEIHQNFMQYQYSTESFDSNMNPFTLNASHTKLAAYNNSNLNQLTVQKLASQKVNQRPSDLVQQQYGHQAAQSSLAKYNEYPQRRMYQN